MVLKSTWLGLAASLAVAWSAVGAHAKGPADLVARAASGTGAAVDHTAWTSLLQAYVKPGADGINRVDYGAFKKDGHGALKAYVRQLEAVAPATLDRNQQFAFFANLYNAKTIDVVLDHYPVTSIKDIKLGGSLLAAFTGGPWKAKVVSVSGMALSLDDIEHEILRPVFKDPRVHYAVNCASIGCPNLATEAFTSGNLEAMLDAGARAYVNHPRGATVAGQSVDVSSIYSWFKADFGGDAGVIAHLRTYAEPRLTEALKGVTSIGGHDYDWSLNDTRTRGKS